MNSAAARAGRFARAMISELLSPFAIGRMTRGRGGRPVGAHANLTSGR
jgi:hypothetical protein